MFNRMNILRFSRIKHLAPTPDQAMGEVLELRIIGLIILVEAAFTIVVEVAHSILKVFMETMNKLLEQGQCRFFGSVRFARGRNIWSDEFLGQ